MSKESSLPTGLFDEMFGSVKSAIKQRMQSPFYGVLTICWVFFNWQIFVVLFFVSESYIFQKSNLLKSEFIFTYLLNPAGLNFWMNLFFTLLFASLVIWFFPLITQKAYRAQERDGAKKKIIFFEENEVIEMRKSDLLDAKQKTKEKELAISRVGEELREENSKIWFDDFQMFKKTKLFKQFNILIYATYEKHGSLKWGYDGSDGIPTKLVAYLHSNALIKIQAGEFQLTEKGKFFVKLYSEEGYELYEEKKQEHIPF